MREMERQASNDETMQSTNETIPDEDNDDPLVGKIIDSSKSVEDEVRDLLGLSSHTIVSLRTGNSKHQRQDSSRDVVRKSRRSKGVSGDEPQRRSSRRLQQSQHGSQRRLVKGSSSRRLQQQDGAITGETKSVEILSINEDEADGTGRQRKISHIRRGSRRSIRVSKQDVSNSGIPDEEQNDASASGNVELRLPSHGGPSKIEALKSQSFRRKSSSRQLVGEKSRRRASMKQESSRRSLRCGDDNSENKESSAEKVVGESAARRRSSVKKEESRRSLHCENNSSTEKDLATSAAPGRQQEPQEKPVSDGDLDIEGVSAGFGRRPSLKKASAKQDSSSNIVFQIADPIDPAEKEKMRASLRSLTLKPCPKDTKAQTDSIKTSQKSKAFVRKKSGEMSTDKKKRKSRRREKSRRSRRGDGDSSSQNDNNSSISSISIESFASSTHGSIDGSLSLVEGAEDVNANPRMPAAVATGQEDLPRRSIEIKRRRSSLKRSRGISARDLHMSAGEVNFAQLSTASIPSLLDMHQHLASSEGESVGSIYSEEVNSTKQSGTTNDVHSAPKNPGMDNNKSTAEIDRTPKSPNRVLSDRSSCSREGNDANRPSAGTMNAPVPFRSSTSLKGDSSSTNDCAVKTAATEERDGHTIASPPSTPTAKPFDRWEAETPLSHSSTPLITQLDEEETRQVLGLLYDSAPTTAPQPSDAEPSTGANRWKADGPSPSSARKQPLAAGGLRFPSFKFSRRHSEHRLLVDENSPIGGDHPPLLKQRRSLGHVGPDNQTLRKLFSDDELKQLDDTGDFSFVSIHKQQKDTPMDPVQRVAETGKGEETNKATSPPYAELIQRKVAIEKSIEAHRHSIRQLEAEMQLLDQQLTSSIDEKN